MSNETLPNLNLETTYRPAVEILKRAIEIDPNCSDARRELARANSILKENNSALVEFKRAIALKPDDPVGCAYLLLGDNEAALAEHKSLEDIAEKTEDYLLKRSYQSKAEELLKKIHTK